MLISIELANNAARQPLLHDKSRTGLAQSNLSFRPDAMFLKVGGADYRQMRISHRRIVGELCFGSGLLEPARQEVRCTARNASP